MAAALETFNLNPISRSDLKSTISPAVVNPTHLPLLQALGLPGDDELVSQNTPQSQPSNPHNSATNRDNNRPQRPSKSQTQQEETTPQRARHLERNRVAANKCRMKKKKEHAQIQSTLNDESARRDSLLAEVGYLKEEIWHLKNQVFAHAKCDDHQINTQLAKMTQSVLQSSPGQLQCPSPTFSMSTKSDDSSGIESRLAPVVPEERPMEEMLYDDDFEPLFDKFIEAGNI